MFEESLPPLTVRLEQARMDYLFGELDTESGRHRRALRNTELLAKKYGLTNLQVAQHAQFWFAELRVHTQLASKEFGRNPSDEMVASHEGDVAFMRDQLNVLREKLNEMPTDRKGLESYDFIMKQFLKLQERWSKLAGVEAALRVSEVTKETIAREEVKMHFEQLKEQPQGLPAPDSRQVNGKIFDIEAVVEKAG